MLKKSFNGLFQPRKRKTRFPASLVYGLWLGVALTGHVEADSLHDVMQSLSAIKQAEVDYQEEKHLNMLDVPLLQTGHLSYLAPDSFTRTLDAPVTGRFAIQGDKVTLEQRGESKQQNLQRLPLVKAFVASFGATLAGDLPRLQQYYELTFSGDTASWALVLIPRDKQLAEYVDEIRLWGREGKIDRMEIQESNGDWSRMILLHE